MFNNIAPSYDLLNHLLSCNVDRYWRWRVTTIVPPISEEARMMHQAREGTQSGPSEQSAESQRLWPLTSRLSPRAPHQAAPILDLCTGTGDLALAYDRAAAGRVPIVGADFCHEMLMRAEAKTRHQKAAERIRFLEADVQHLPLPSDLFQITTVAFGLRNVTDTDKGIAEMVRVTRPGGKVAILEFSRPRGFVFGPLYHFYFRHLLPGIGQLISRSKDNAYRYLPESVMQFPDGEALAKRLRAHGLIEVKWHPLTFGIATLYVGTKPTVKEKDEG
jgi:demethylmenaquinone methyltransferase/2-methoxy-6-polyprenyl-1,4-benzoquinol methylase